MIRVLDERAGADYVSVNSFKFLAACLLSGLWSRGRSRLSRLRQVRFLKMLGKVGQDDGSQVRPCLLPARGDRRPSSSLYFPARPLVGVSRPPSEGPNPVCLCSPITTAASLSSLSRDDVARAGLLKARSLFYGLCNIRTGK